MLLAVHLEPASSSGKFCLPFGPVSQSGRPSAQAAARSLAFGPVGARSMPRPALPAIELRLIVTPTVALLVMLTPMPELLRTVFSAKRCPEPVSATAVPPLSEILLLLITLPGPLTERPGPRLNESSYAVFCLKKKRHHLH